MDLSGKVAIVTGASRGIGEAIALELARAGADIALMARSTEAAPSKNFVGTIDDVAAAVAALGKQVLAIQGDVALEQDVNAACDATLSRFGRCDIVVNNAAVSYLAPFLELTPKRWDVIMAVNVGGPMLMSRAFLPQMIERGAGHIVNISSADGRLDLDSVAELVTMIGHDAATSTFGASAKSLAHSRTAYGTSKAALNRLTVGLAAEFAEAGIAINALEVSAVTQPLLKALPDADHSSNELPESPAQLVAWIAAQPTDYTGNILSQFDLLPALRASGAIRPRVAPHAP